MEAVNTTAVPLHERPAWHAWPPWVLYTAIGALVSAALGVVVTVFVPGGLLLSPVMLALGALIVGFLQWLVLRHYIPGIRRLGWVLATVLGQFVGSVLVIVGVAGPVLFGALENLPDTVDASAMQFAIQFIGGALLGTALGVAQWLVLQRYVRKSGWWVPASLLAGGISAVIPPLQALNFGLGGAAVVILTKVFTGAISAAITGVALAWLLRRPWKLESSVD